MCIYHVLYVMKTGARQARSFTLMLLFLFLIFINFLLGCSSVAYGSKRAMWEWQSLSQMTHLCVLSGRMEMLPSFLRARLSAAAVISLSSSVLRYNSPLFAISCKALPRRSDDVDHLHISYADIFISQVRAAGGSSPQSQLTAEDVFWNATILHTTHMNLSSTYALSTHNVHTWKTSTIQDTSIGYVVLPGYAQYTGDASQLECVDPSLLSGIM